jgi:tRNA 2-thiouridine synthesizing protein E
MLVATVTLAGRDVEIDEDGFIQDPEVWDEAVAQALAETEGVAAMTEGHWTIVKYLRNYYLEFGVAPMIRKLVKETQTPLKQIYELFPSGPAKGACKVAGLPKPTGCV